MSRIKSLEVKNMSTMILTRKDVVELLDMRSVMEVVERVFTDLSLKRARIPAKSYLNLEYGDFRVMPAFIPNAVGVKWVNVHPNNPAIGLPTVMAVIIYNDPDTGYPLAIMDATEITAYRTGAAAAIASKYLARDNSQSLGIIGAGYQAHSQIVAHNNVFNFERIKAYDLKETKVKELIESHPDLPIENCSLESVSRSDILCTLTPARKPFLTLENITPGTHINAIGADAKGKQELDFTILKKAIVVVDDLVQARTSGEINVPVSRGLYSIDSIYATLGDVILGNKTARKSDEDITVFDSTGVAVEDIAVAKLVYERAKNSDKYLNVNLTNGKPS